jgi:DNA polymerase-3 subunit alpha
MRKLLKDLALGGPLTFDDLVAVVALFRPGPLDAGLCDEYVQIKQGARTPYYEHPNMEPALRKTFGVIVYQEQVMQIARDVAGFTMAQADHLRKAMGKKDPEKMKEMRHKFVDGCVGVVGHGPFARRPVGQDRGLRRVRLQPVALGRVFAHFLLDDVAQDPLPRRVLRGRAVDSGQGRAPGPAGDGREGKGIKVLPPDINGSTEDRDPQRLRAPGAAPSGEGHQRERRRVRSSSCASSPAGLQHAGALQSEGASAPASAGATPQRRRRHSGGPRSTSVTCRPSRASAPSSPSTARATRRMHPNRLKDRLELMPGYTVESVKADRTIDDASDLTKRALLTELMPIRGPAIAARSRASPTRCRAWGKPRSSWPSSMVRGGQDQGREDAGGRRAEVPQGSAEGRGAQPNDGYYTSLVKGEKQGKGYNEQINGCSSYLAKEIEVLKPPVILVLGSNALRYLVPALKGFP